VNALDAVSFLDSKPVAEGLESSIAHRYMDFDPIAHSLAPRSPPPPSDPEVVIPPPSVPAPPSSQVVADLDGLDMDVVV
jgi:hypothetical protein